MNRYPSCCLGLGVALAFSASVQAQGPGHFPQSNELVSRASISATMGQCLLKRNRAGAISLVNATTESTRRASEKRVHADMVACLGARSSATLDTSHLNGAIAERLLADDDGALLVRASALVPIAPVRVVAGESAGAMALTCAVAADPGAAVAMLHAPAESTAEAAAFRRLAPSLQACVPATGSVAIKPFIVRATVATSLYRAVSQVN